MKQQHSYEILCDAAFNDQQWHAVDMFMDYANNLGLTGEALTKIDPYKDKVILTTEDYA